VFSVRLRQATVGLWAEPACFAHGIGQAGLGKADVCGDLILTGK
jgi:hypothetical protein